MKFFAAIVFLFLSFIGFSQTNQNGLIIPKNFSDKSFDNYCCVFAPQQGFKLYDAPNGNIIGIVKEKLKNDKLLKNKYNIILKSGNQTIIKPFKQGLSEIGYEIYAINFYKTKNGFVKILNPKSSYWLKVAELNDFLFDASSWQDFLLKNQYKLLGYYANKPGLNLRESPSKNAKILKTLRGNLFEIKLLPQSKGNWNKVKVIKYQEHPCKGNLTKEENTEYILEGWIKTIDDSGTPNIWYYPRGC